MHGRERAVTLGLLILSEDVDATPAEGYSPRSSVFPALIVKCDSSWELASNFLLLLFCFCLYRPHWRVTDEIASGIRASLIITSLFARDSMIWNYFVYFCVGNRCLGHTKNMLTYFMLPQLNGVASFFRKGVALSFSVPF